MIPGLAQLIGITIAAGALFWAGDQYGTNGRKLDRERSAWSQAQADALTEQAETYKAKLAAQEAINADTKRMLDQSRTQANAADAVVATGDADRRRLRDAIATSDLGIQRALEAAGTARQCATALEAANLRGRMLERLDADAGALEADAAAVGRHADEAYGASVGCKRAYEVAR